MHTAALSLIYSTAEYCATGCCRCVHTRLIDSVQNDALQIVIGRLRSTLTQYLSVLSGIQSIELRGQGAILSIANRGCLDPNYILQGRVQGSQTVNYVKLKSRRSFVPAARILLASLSEMDIRAVQ